MRHGKVCVPKANKVDAVLRRMKKEGVDSEYASPEYVHSFAWHRGFELTSKEVVEISDRYGEKESHTEWQRRKGHLFEVK